jgi:hypothetical protein
VTRMMQLHHYRPATYYCNSNILRCMVTVAVEHTHTLAHMILCTVAHSGIQHTQVRLRNVHTNKKRHGGAGLRQIMLENLAKVT